MTFLLSILTNRLLWGFLGATAIAAVIWLIGPLFSIVDTRPLESTQSRVITMAVVYFIWAQSHIVPRLYNAWLNRKLMDNLQKQNTEEAVKPAAALNNEEQILAQRFDEAAQMLKKAHFSHTPKGHQRWTERFSTQYLYQLPWYVIIGAPGAGKTTALANSGLQFPLADRFGKTALRGIGGTRNCDWWFTNEAVLLDTAGRYTTQESDQQRDSQEWLKFVSLIRKYRRRQPINGIILTISISDLLTQSAEDSQAQAVNLRQRLAELHEQLGIRFPVYVFITKADLLKGFRDWFAEYDKSQRNQIWGFTFPWEKNKHADFDLLQHFHQEFSLLHQRLEAGLADSMLSERNAESRANMWLFPQEFAALRPLLADYLHTIFARSNFETEFSPRGVYFASGTQEGLPFDRVMGELSRSLDLPKEKAKEGNDRQQWDGISKEAPIPGGKGQSFFIKDLLQRVVFQEAGIAGQHRWWEWGNRAFVWVGYAVLLLVLGILGALWLISYGKNKAYLHEVAEKIPAIEQQSQVLQQQPQRDLFSMLPLVNQLAALPQSQSFDLDHPTIARRMGLYRGEDVSDAANSLYHKALQQMMLPEVARQVTTWLRNDDGSDAEYSYEALKAYQMLYQPKHYDGRALLSWVMLNIRRQLPQNITQTELASLESHLQQLLVPQIQSSPFAKDEQLIAREKSVITQQPLSGRVYGRLKRLLEHDDQQAPVSFASLGGPQSELVFSRKSGQSISDGVPALYTPSGYWNRFNKRITAVTSSLHDDDRWVLGTSSVPEDKTQTDNAVRQLYMRDFMRYWDNYLADIQLNNNADLSSRINTARLLSSNNSPLRRLVINLSQVLTLTRPAVQGSEKQNTDAQNGATKTLEVLFGDKHTQQEGAISATPEQQVTDHYASLIELAQPLEKGSNNIVFDDFLKQIDDLYRYLTAVQDATNSGMQPPSSESISRLQASAGRLPGGLQTMFTKMAVGASSDTQQRDLDNMRKRISVEIGGFCRQAIAGRYPLVRSAASDVTPDDLSRMFAPGSGMMDSFFRDNLTNKVNTTQATWRFMPGIDGKTLPGSEGVLRPFQQAQSIRDAFFANGATTPSFKVTLRTISMDNDIYSLSVDVDGQILRYSHGPQAVQMMSWPGSGGTNQVRMQLAFADGTTSSLVTSGNWALNRFFDKGRTTAGSSGSLSRRVTFSVEGHQVVLEYTPNSIRNPFQLSRFSCP